MNVKTQAVTLVELMVAVFLLSMILLTGATVDLASRRFLRVSDRQAELQNEISPILLGIKRDVNRAVGWSGNSGIAIPAGNRIDIRMDVDANGIQHNPPTMATGDDRWYTYQTVGNEMRYYGPYVGALPGVCALPACRVLSSRVTGFFTALRPSPSGLPIGAAATITACYNPAGVAPNQCNTANNPIMTLGITSYSLSQSGS